MKIYVNAREHLLDPGFVTYRDVVNLAEERGTPTVTYHVRLDGDLSRSGVMYTGCKPVDLADGMVFNVMHTDNA